MVGLNGKLFAFSFCDVCSAVSRSISWSRCLPVVTAESMEQRFLKKLAHFLAFQMLKSESSLQMRISIRN